MECVAYEVLLKPANESLLKNWSVSLTMYLDKFMEHLEDEEDTNFTEAAVMLQNTTTYYCKRVDVIYSMIQELVVNMDVVPSENENLAKKTKKVTNSKLENDDLQLAYFVASKNSTDINEANATFKSVHKQIVPHLVVQALRKVGTSLPVLQRNGSVLGSKEEFRIFWKVGTEGAVNDEANNVGAMVAVENGDSFHDSVEHEDNNDQWGQDHDPCDQDNDPCDQDNDPFDQDNDLPVAHNAPEEDEVEFQVACAPKKRIKPIRNDDWEPVPGDFKFPLRKLNVKWTVRIPSELWGSEVDTCGQQLNLPGRKRKRPKPPAEDPPLQFNWVDQAIMAGTTDALEYSLSLESKKRKAILTKLRKTDPGTLMGIAESDDDDDNFNDEGHDFEDNDDEVAHPVATGELSRFEEAPPEGDFDDDAVQAIQKFHERRKEYAKRATKIAERVAKWHDAIRHVVEEAENRSEFDVHHYGTRILRTFPNNDRDTFVPFKSVVGKLTNKSEVSRYFLSTLMLVNTNNLELRKNENQPLVKDCVELRLIKKERGNKLTNNVDNGEAATSEVHL